MMMLMSVEICNNHLYKKTPLLHRCYHSTGNVDSLPSSCSVLLVLSLASIVPVTLPPVQYTQPESTYAVFNVIKKESEFVYVITNLLLEGENVSDTAINGVTNASLSFIGDGDNSLTAIGNRDM